MTTVAGRRAGAIDWRVAGVAVAVVIVVSLVGGLATDTDSDWYRGLDRPSFQPPGAAFGIVWTALYALIAVSITLTVSRATGAERRALIGLWAANLLVNVAWTWIFFQAHSPVAAGIEILVLLGSTLALIARSAPWSRTGALLLVPYALWGAFATVLTWTIALSN
jgi:Tryptophan-rich sensory protein (mitochondrial benzodiazepine receptor homolog)